MAVGAIPYTAVMEYIRFWDLSEESACLLIDVVTILDGVYIQEANKKRSLHSQASGISNANQHNKKPVTPKRPRKIVTNKRR